MAESPRQTGEFRVKGMVNLDGRHRRRPGLLADQRDLAEGAAAAERRDAAAVDDDVELALLDDVEGVARLALADQILARAHGHLVHGEHDVDALVVLHVLEERRVLQSFQDDRLRGLLLRDDGLDEVLV